MIDYSIRRGRGTGPQIDLAPGHTGPVDAELIHVDEDAFFAIEGFFDSGQINHYGPSVVGAKDWSKAMESIAAEAKARREDVQLKDFNLDQIEGWSWLVRHPQILADVRLRGAVGLLALLTMLDDMSDTGMRWAAEHPAVYISGV